MTLHKWHLHACHVDVQPGFLHSDTTDHTAYMKYVYCHGLLICVELGCYGEWMLFRIDCTEADHHHVETDCEPASALHMDTSHNYVLITKSMTYMLFESGKFQHVFLNRWTLWNIRWHGLHFIASPLQILACLSSPYLLLICFAIFLFLFEGKIGWKCLITNMCGICVSIIISYVNYVLIILVDIKWYVCIAT